MIVGLSCLSVSASHHPQSLMEGVQSPYLNRYLNRIFGHVHDHSFCVSLPSGRKLTSLCASYTSWCILSFILFNEASYRWSSHRREVWWLQVRVSSDARPMLVIQSSEVRPSDDASCNMLLSSLGTQSEMGTKSSNKWIPYETMNVYCILLMEEILHQLTGSLSHCLKGFLHLRWLFGIFFHQQYVSALHHWRPRVKRFPVLKFEIPPLKERKYSWSGDRLHWWGWMQGKVERL